MKRRDQASSEPGSGKEDWAAEGTGVFFTLLSPLPLSPHPHLSQSNKSYKVETESYKNLVVALPATVPLFQIFRQSFSRKRKYNMKSYTKCASYTACSPKTLTLGYFWRPRRKKAFFSQLWNSVPYVQSLWALLFLSSTIIGKDLACLCLVQRC